MKRLSRFTGISYLIIFITGIYANFSVLQSLLVPGDVSATANNIANNEGLFRIGIFSFILMVIFDVLVAWALYVLLKQVNKNLSLLAGWLRLINATIFGVALYNLFGVLQLINGEEYLNLFGAGQLYANVMFLLDTFNNIWLIGLLFFGLHLAVLGYLIFKSGFIPKIIGILLMIAAVGYLVDSFANFLLPNYTDYQTIFTVIVIVPGVIGELSLTLWLLIKGVKDQ